MCNCMALAGFFKAFWGVSKRGWHSIKNYESGTINLCINKPFLSPVLSIQESWSKEHTKTTTPLWKLSALLLLTLNWLSKCCTNTAAFNNSCCVLRGNNNCITRHRKVARHDILLNTETIKHVKLSRYDFFASILRGWFQRPWNCPAQKWT